MKRVSSNYAVLQKPDDKLWYIVGRAGKYWMQVSDGFTTEAQAILRAKKQVKTDYICSRLGADSV